MHGPFDPASINAWIRLVQGRVVQAVSLAACLYAARALQRPSGIAAQRETLTPHLSIFMGVGQLGDAEANDNARDLCDLTLMSSLSAHGPCHAPLASMRQAVDRKHWPATGSYRSGSLCQVARARLVTFSNCKAHPRRAQNSLGFGALGKHGSSLGSSGKPGLD